MNDDGTDLEVLQQCRHLVFGDWTSAAIFVPLRVWIGELTSRTKPSSSAARTMASLISSVLFPNWRIEHGGGLTQEILVEDREPTLRAPQHASKVEAISGNDQLSTY
jgi:hypothetical protein